MRLSLTNDNRIDPFFCSQYPLRISKNCGSLPMPDITESCSRYPRSWRISGLLLYTPSMVTGRYGMLLPPPLPYFRCGILPCASCTLYVRPSCAGWVTSTSARPSGQSNTGRLLISKLARNCTSKTSRSSANDSTLTLRATTCYAVSRHVLLFSPLCNYG